ncbi:MAG: class I SAM-dependent methyltransferase [Hyphomicrobiales bacterium]|nr:class I SAM-dependent methyltransferase [Hyphomicrobiales bacterium]MBV8825628.1 class I SAM-dependent methyltransferase [Hyphomicrobiales bacterium]MBV9427387.1 class I SAM-dependent methyltransferase [Bradyrhizobiaceae bacterium]
MIDISSGHAALDAFLAGHYLRIRGMSSRFAAAICGHIMRRQTALGITGDLLEIGTFEGRFFIAMAMLLAPDEHGVGIDVFTWPSARVYDHFLANCADAGLDAHSYTAWKTDTRTITADDLRAKLPAGAARFVHVDGEHNVECLTQDLELAHAVLHPDGVIVIDDMLHPGYPTLVTTVLDYLARHPEMRVLCIIDRESITAAAKFVLCRVDRVASYEQDLMTTFAKFHYVLGAYVTGYLTLVLTPDPTLPKVD